MWGAWEMTGSHDAPHYLCSLGMWLEAQSRRNGCSDDLRSHHVLDKAC